MTISTQQSRRRSALAAIHIAKKKLGLEEETYRAMLQEVAGSIPPQTWTCAAWAKC